MERGSVNLKGQQARRVVRKSVSLRAPIGLVRVLVPRSGIARTREGQIMKRPGRDELFSGSAAGGGPV